MLFLSACMWTVMSVGYHPNESERGAEQLHEELNRGIQDVGAVVLFLLPAMGVVETIDHLHGFTVVTQLILRWTKGQKHRLMPIVRRAPYGWLHISTIFSTISLLSLE